MRPLKLCWTIWPSTNITYFVRRPECCRATRPHWKTNSARQDYCVEDSASHLPELTFPTGSCLMQVILQDLRYAFRQLRKHPGFAITAILALGLGIGATTAVFSVAYGVLIDPFPYKDVHTLATPKLCSRWPQCRW